MSDQQTVTTLFHDLADAVGERVSALTASQAALAAAEADRAAAYEDALERLRRVWEAEMSAVTYTQTAIVDQLTNVEPSPSGGLDAETQLELAEVPNWTQAGVDRDTFKWMTGWSHVVQSIGDILTTRIMSRVFRRQYGSDVPRLIDRSMDDRVVMALFVAAATALQQWEPRFKLHHLNLEEASADGHVKILFRGIYYPKWGVTNGALWVDKSVADEKSGFTVWR